MRRLIALVTAGVLALVVQGALATLLAPPWCPDLALLVVVIVALRWRGLALGLCLAAALGFSADLLSGSLFGQHALLRLFIFVTAFFAGRQLNLKGSLPLVVFAAAATFAYGLALFAVSAFFIGGALLDWSWVAELILHSVVNGIVAPLVFAAVTRASIWAGDEDAAARMLHIDARRRHA